MDAIKEYLKGLPQKLKDSPVSHGIILVVGLVAGHIFK